MRNFPFSILPLIPRLVHYHS